MVRKKRKRAKMTGTVRVSSRNSASQNGYKEQYTPCAGALPCPRLRRAAGRPRRQPGSFACDAASRALLPSAWRVWRGVPQRGGGSAGPVGGAGF